VETNLGRESNLRTKSIKQKFKYSKEKPKSRRRNCLCSQTLDDRRTIRLWKRQRSICSIYYPLCLWSFFRQTM